MAYLFFLLFAPTLIPEAFQIKTVCSKKIITKVLKKLSVNDQNYFLLISHTLERNKPSHSNQFYCKKTTTALRRKSKSFHFCNELLLSVPNPCIQILCPPNVFCSSKKTPPAFSRVSTVFNNSWNDSATTYQHFWLRTTRVYHQNQKSKVPTTIISFSLQFSDQRDDNALLFNLEKKRENEWIK